MKRRSFLKVSGTSACSFLMMGSLVEFLSSCSKGLGFTSMGGIMNQPIYIFEGNFVTPLQNPASQGSIATFIPQLTTANIAGNKVEVLGYQPNNILGPTIRINQGDIVNFQLLNHLAEPTNIHWHGLEIPVSMDGHPSNVIDPNGNYNYRYTVTQRASLSWYHPHPDGSTAIQVFKGLAGMFLINDPEELALNLPSGSNELLLVIQDKRIVLNAIDYSPTTMDMMSGYMGDLLLINGNISPVKEVNAGFYRFRILNGSNSRIYNLALSNHADLVIIGNDGGLLKTPSPVNNILLAPGERLDILVNFSGLSVGTEIFLQSNLFSGAGNTQGKQEFKILKFKITKSITDTFTIPAKLSNIISQSVSSAQKTRTFTISSMQMQSGMSQSGIHKINNKVYDRNRIDEYVTSNSTEIWVFDNTQGTEPHPIHIHGLHFQILDRTGGRNQLTPSELGWKDTVLVMPGEMVRVIILFPNLKGTFVFHCHNLEHEDNGMMLQFQIT